MADRDKAFADKYRGVDKIFSGHSFFEYRDYKDLLAELPVSSVAEGKKKYSRCLTGNLDYVYGEMLYTLTGYEGYLRDKAFPLKECAIRPIIKPNSAILEFDLAYRTKAGEDVTQTFEVIRLGETKYMYCLDYYRPL